MTDQSLGWTRLCFTLLTTLEPLASRHDTTDIFDIRHMHQHQNYEEQFNDKDSAHTFKTHHDFDERQSKHNVHGDGSSISSNFILYVKPTYSGLTKRWKNKNMETLNEKHMCVDGTIKLRR